MISLTSTDFEIAQEIAIEASRQSMGNACATVSIQLPALIAHRISCIVADYASGAVAPSPWSAPTSTSGGKL